MKYFDLFSGAGGFRLGMERAGHECVGACEIDRYARQVYNRHFDNTPLFWDATTLDPKDIPSFDILCAGFPCQSFSVAGFRKGFDDTRGTLFFEIIRIAKEKRPLYLFLENVRGLLFHDKGKTFKTMLITLDELGYDVEWQVINSKYFVPQSRDRTFIIGHIRGKRTREIFPLGEICGVSKETHQTKYLPSLTATDYKGPSKERAGNMIVKLGNVVDSPSNSLGVRCYDTKGIAPSLVANGGGLGGKSGLYALPKKTDIYALSHTKGNMKQRHQERDTTWGLDTSGNKMAVGEGMRIRRLTPIECERLQGFPDDWTKGLSDTQRYKLMGNAVTVDVVQYIAKHFEEIDVGGHIEHGGGVCGCSMSESI